MHTLPDNGNESLTKCDFTLAIHPFSIPHVSLKKGACHLLAVPYIQSFPELAGKRLGEGTGVPLEADCAAAG